MYPARLAFLLISACCAAPQRLPLDVDAPVEERTVVAGGQREALTFTLENDGVVGTDNNYTHGVVLGWISGERSTYPDDALRRRWIELGSFLPFVGRADYRTFATFSLGHEMFTPNDITVPTPPPEDRPYAGVLFLDSSFFALREDIAHA